MEVGELSLGNRPVIHSDNALEGLPQHLLIGRVAATFAPKALDVTEIDYAHPVALRIYNVVQIASCACYLLTSECLPMVCPCCVLRSRKPNAVIAPDMDRSLVACRVSAFRS